MFTTIPVVALQLIFECNLLICNIQLYWDLVLNFITLHVMYEILLAVFVFVI